MLREKTGFAVLVFIFLFIIAKSSLLYGQAFLVRPMRIEIDPPPNSRVNIPLELRNTMGDRARALELAVVELSQSRTGAWIPVDSAGDDDNPPEQIPSCRSWIELEETEVEIEPLDGRTVTVGLHVPPRARGAYFAAILAQSRPPEDAEGIALRMRFLIPVIVRIQGRPVREQIELSDANMQYRPASEERPATTAAVMTVTNEGSTYSRVSGELRVERKSGERWRPVARVESRERGIMPGVTFELVKDLNRRLPSGTYRMRGVLHVDGRRKAPFTREIEFAGDPGIDDVAYDQTLELNPGRVEIDARAGAVRSEVVTVSNPGEDPVDVNVSAALPKSLQGVMMGDVRGDSMGALEWISARPAEFQLGPNGRQNLRLIARLPRKGLEHPYYYADLRLNARYEDGQSAGETRSLVLLRNSEREAQVKAQAERLSLSADRGSRYIVQSKFTNVGNAHFTPNARAVLRPPRGDVELSTRLSGDEGVMLPLAGRHYSGVMDFENVAPGRYVLEVQMMFGDGERVRKRRLIDIGPEEAGEAGAGRRTVSFPEDGADTLGKEMDIMQLNGGSRDAQSDDRHRAIH